MALAGVNLDHLIELDAVQLVGAAQRGMLGIGGGDGFKARSTERGVTGSLDCLIRNWNVRERGRERPESDQQRASARYVSPQAVFKPGRHHPNIAQHHEGIFRQRLITSLLNRQRFESEAGFGDGFEGGTVIQLVAILAGRMQK